MRISDTSGSTSLSVRVWLGQLELVRQGARAKSMSVPDYVRSVLVRAAAVDVGVNDPVYPAFAHKGRQSLVTTAATSLGMSAQDFRRQALEAAAGAVVARLGHAQDVVAAAQPGQARRTG